MSTHNVVRDAMAAAEEALLTAAGADAATRTHIDLDERARAFKLALRTRVTEQQRQRLKRSAEVLWQHGCSG